MHTRQRAQLTGTNRPTQNTPHQPPTEQHPRPLYGPRPTHPHHTTHPQPAPPSPTTASAVTAGRTRPDPSRTRKLRTPAPMVLRPPGRGRAGHRRDTHEKAPVGAARYDAVAPTGAFQYPRYSRAATTPLTAASRQRGTARTGRQTATRRRPADNQHRVHDTAGPPRTPDRSRFGIRPVSAKERGGRSGAIG